jgi:hypothetical protein
MRILCPLFPTIASLPPPAPVYSIAAILAGHALVMGKLPGVCSLCHRVL